MPKIIRKNALAYLADCGEMGYWVIARINGKRTRLNAGETLADGLRIFSWYEEV